MSVYSKYMTCALYDNGGQDDNAVIKNFEIMFNIIASEPDSKKICSIESGDKFTEYCLCIKDCELHAARFPDGLVVINLLNRENDCFQYDYIHPRVLQKLKILCF